MKRKLVSLLLTGALLCGMMPGALAVGAGLSNFKKAETYSAGKFTDVASGAWYVESVKTAYELDLVKGSSATTFSPSGNITVGSVLALACRLHSIYTTGTAEFRQGNPWYQVYVDYAVKNGIITQGQFTNYNANATRRQCAAILAKSMPSEALTAINTVADGQIPDVASGSANYADIYTLYRAGVLTGNDKYGTFAPETTIDRASVAAIVSRMAMPSLRKTLALETAATGVTLNKSSLSLAVGGTASLTATVIPDGATNKTLTWKSSKPAVATVSNGTVTAVAEGTATITVSTANGKSATCTVTVEKAPSFANYLVGLEMGPFTVTDNRYSTPRTTRFTSFMFTKIEETSIGKYFCDLSIQGTCTDDSVFMYLYFYDASGRVLSKELVSEDVVPNQTFNSLVDVHVDKNVMDQAVRVEVYSAGNDKAVYGSGSSNPSGSFEGGSSSPATTPSSDLTGFAATLLNKEFGPFLIRDSRYSDNREMGFDSFMFTNIEKTSIGKYFCDLSIQGKSTSDSVFMYIYFYDASGRVLKKQLVSEDVVPNQTFNTLVDVHVDYDVMDNAARVEFYSGGNDAAIYGKGSADLGSGSSSGSQGGSSSSGGSSSQGGSSSSGGSGSQSGGSTTLPDYGYETYYNFDGIPTFDQFTSSGRVTISTKTNVESYMYASATTSELDAYMKALEECGFTQLANLGGTLITYTKGTSGESDYREVRLSVSSAPTSSGTSVGVIISKIRPSNEW